jgi:hypothetical protein
MPSGAEIYLERIWYILSGRINPDEPGDPAGIIVQSSVADGNTTDAPASSTVAETAASKTGISLWKGIKNILIALNAKFVSGTVIGDVNIMGKGFSIPMTLTVTNGAYTIADVVGGLITFAGAGSAAGKRSVIYTITLAGVAALAYELWLFGADIVTPAADNAAFTLVAADVAQCKGVIPIAITDYLAPVSAFNVATLRSVGFEFTCVNTTLYAYLKAVAATSPGTTTLTLTIKGEFID